MYGIQVYVVGIAPLAERPVAAPLGRPDWSDGAVACFSVTFEACFKMESLDGLQTSVDLEYRLEAETFQPGRRFSRVRFLDGQEDRQNVVTRTLPLSANNTRYYFCQEETMVIKVSGPRPVIPIPKS